MAMRAPGDGKNDVEEVSQPHATHEPAVAASPRPSSLPSVARPTLTRAASDERQSDNAAKGDTPKGRRHDSAEGGQHPVCEVLRGPTDNSPIRTHKVCRGETVRVQFFWQCFFFYFESTFHLPSHLNSAAFTPTHSIPFPRRAIRGR